MIALVDGDIVVYRSAFAAEHTYYLLYNTAKGETPDSWEFLGRFDSATDYKNYVKEKGLEDFAVTTEREVEPVENVLYSIKHTIASIKKALRAKEVRVFLSKGENFRHKKATLAVYKGNRAKTDKPVHYDAAREYLVNYHNAEVCESIEADDALALNQTADTVICSIDKDLLQVEGKHYNWVKDEKILVKPRAALCRLYEQVLTGDSTDNIPGIHGIGPAKAKAMIAECAGKAEMEELCKWEWAKALAKKDGKGVQRFELRDPSKVTPKEAMNEVLMLVTVGGDAAKEAMSVGTTEVRGSDSKQGKAKGKHVKKDAA